MSTNARVVMLAAKLAATEPESREAEAVAAEIRKAGLGRQVSEYLRASAAANFAEAAALEAETAMLVATGRLQPGQKERDHDQIRRRS